MAPQTNSTKLSLPVTYYDTDVDLQGFQFLSTEEPSQRLELLSPAGYSASIFFFFSIWIIGTTGNCLVIWLVAKNKELRTPINMLLVNLAVADLFMAAVGSPFPMIAAFHRSWPFGRPMCTLYGFGMALGGIGSITTLMVLAFERYLMISRPFQIQPIGMRHSIGIIVAVWAYSASLTAPPLFGWASYDFEGPRISCSIGWEAGDKLTNSYISFLFMMGLVLPCITICGSYLQIVRTVVTSASSRQGGAVERAELRVVLMVATMVISFLMAWTPYAIVSLIITFGKSVSPPMALIPALIAKSSTCYNPIIYVGLNTQFRAAWRKAFTNSEGRDRDENTIGFTVAVIAGDGQSGTAGEER